jgi:hypothetical protein
VSAKEKMRQCYEDVTNDVGYAAAAYEYSTQLLDRFSDENMYKQFCDAFYSVSKEQAEWLGALSEIELV